MAVYDLEEQEQIDELKTWWKQYGNLVTGLLITVLVGMSAWRELSKNWPISAASAGWMPSTRATVPSAPATAGSPPPYTGTNRTPGEYVGTAAVAG